MSWKFVLKLAESAEHRSMTGLLVNRYPNGFFTASRAGEDCREFLLDYSNYSASSSPQPLTTHPLTKGGVNIYLWSRVSSGNELKCCQREPSVFDY